MASCSHYSSNKVCMQSDVLDYERELEWTIKNVSKFRGYDVGSKEFSIASSSPVKWQLQMTIGDDINTTSVKIRRTDLGAPDEIEADIEGSLENSKGDVYHRYHLVTCFEKNSEYSAADYVSVEDGRTTQEGKTLEWKFSDRLHNDVLILRCRITVEACVVTETVSKSEYQNTMPKHQLSTDFLRGLQMLHAEMPLADVVLNVGGTSTDAHKAILCARSPVFRNMLETDMKEKRSGVIEIEDIQPEVMKEFLLYLYTDWIGDLPLVVIRELYKVADKYQVGSLRDECGLVLLKNLDEKTVCKTLKLADEHSDGELKEVASKYIRDNIAALNATEEFKALVESDPSLVLHIVISKCLI